MTETASGAASQNGKSPDQGLTMRRIYTRAGVHPYDEVTWERRDVVMTNWRDGSVNFEQHGVEFPDFWSVNAANIVTTKYFRGAVGTPQREWSLKQLVDRVVGTYTAAGREHGYFAAENINGELHSPLRSRRNSSRLPDVPTLLKVSSMPSTASTAKSLREPNSATCPRSNRERDSCVTPACAATAPCFNPASFRFVATAWPSSWSAFIFDIYIKL